MDRSYIFTTIYGWWKYTFILKLKTQLQQIKVKLKVKKYFQVVMSKEEKLNNILQVKERYFFLVVLH